MNEMQVYSRISGGLDLIAWFNRVPSFHDAEIISLDLHRRGQSVLKIHTWNITSELDERGYYILDKHAVVSFFVEDILDLQLDGFSHQNVIYGLTLRYAPDRPERNKFYALEPSPNDFEIELEPCFGMDGRIRCRQIEIRLTPGLPDDYRSFSTA